MTRLEQEGPLEQIHIELTLVDAGVMEEAALRAEASFSSKPLEEEAAEAEAEAEADEENALATRRGEDNESRSFEDDAELPSFEDEEPELTDPDQNEQDEP
jgi:hypothetical protein